MVDNVYITVYTLNNGETIQCHLWPQMTKGSRSKWEDVTGVKTIWFDLIVQSQIWVRIRPFCSKIFFNIWKYTLNTEHWTLTLGKLYLDWYTDKDVLMHFHTFTNKLRLEFCYICWNSPLEYLISEADDSISVPKKTCTRSFKCEKRSKTEALGSSKCHRNTLYVLVKDRSVFYLTWTLNQSYRVLQISTWEEWRGRTGVGMSISVGFTLRDNMKKVNSESGNLT